MISEEIVKAIMEERRELMYRLGGADDIISYAYNWLADEEKRSEQAAAKKGATNDEAVE